MRHEFLAKIRSEGAWQKIQAVLTSKGGTLAFAVINEIATKGWRNNNCYRVVVSIS